MIIRAYHITNMYRRKLPDMHDISYKLTKHITNDNSTASGVPQTSSDGTSNPAASGVPQNAEQTSSDGTSNPAASGVPQTSSDGTNNATASNVPQNAELLSSNINMKADILIRVWDYRCKSTIQDHCLHKVKKRYEALCISMNAVLADPIGLYATDTWVTENVIDDGKMQDWFVDTDLPDPIIFHVMQLIKTIKSKVDIAGGWGTSYTNDRFIRCIEEGNNLFIVVFAGSAFENSKLLCRCWYSCWKGFSVAYKCFIAIKKINKTYLEKDIMKLKLQNNVFCDLTSKTDIEIYNTLYQIE